MPPPKPPSAKAPGAVLPATPGAKVIQDKFKRKRAAQPVTIQERYQEEIADFAGVPPSFETWLKRQPAAVQLEFFNWPTRRKAWLDVVPFEGFVNETKILNLGELRARYPGEVGAA